MDLTLPQFNVNDTYKHFVVTKSTPIPEIRCHLIELKHKITNARVIHIANDDDENVFCIGFQTIPQDSKGIAHILEHTVLCGSTEYPVKDPFFSMLRRSLNTFMNAFTGSDFTCYPASSQVEKDFYNLFEVYLDAAFFPQLKKTSFLQEGHRLEFEDNTPTSPLVFKGVVYNEMKGAATTPDERLWHTLMKNLFPSITYRYDSGGSPNEIIKLTYEELLAFHSTFYHPSNALFFFYGNLPLEKHLDFIQEKVLDQFDAPIELPSIGTQERFEKPVDVSSSYAIEENAPLEKKAMITFGFMTCPITDQETLLSLSLLDTILMDTDASPLKRELLNSGLFSQVDSVLDTEISQVPWVFVFKGCEAEDKTKIYELFQQSLKKITQKPLEKKLINAAIHQLEFSRSEIGEDDYPYGLGLFMRACLPALHKCPPEEALKIHSLIESIKEKTQDPSYLTSLIETYLIDNSHLVLLDMKPNPSLQQKEEKEEKELLQKIKKDLSDHEKENIIKQTEELKKYQEEMEAKSIDILPNLAIKDIPSHTKSYDLKESDNGMTKTYHHNCFTNNIVYTDLLFSLPDLSEFPLPLISFFQSILPELGSGGRSYIENLNDIQTSLGDLSSSLSIFRSVNDPDQYTPVFSVRAKALSKNAPKLFSFIYDLITSADLKDEKRILELLNQQNIILQSSLPRNSMKYASQLAASGIDTPSKINNQWFGLPYLEMIKSLAQNPKGLIDQLQTLQQKILSFSKLDLVISCDEKDFQTFESNRFYQLAQLPSSPTTPWNAELSLPEVSSQGKIISSPVSFSSQAYKTIGYLDPSAPSLVLASNLMDHLILHKKIREEGGAYGSGANFAPLSGLFTFYAFRDPHLTNTYNVFDEAIDLICNGTFSEKDLHEAKLVAIQGMDAPVSPGNRGIVAYSWKRSGRTPEIREAFRSQLLKTTKEEIISAVENHLRVLKGKENSISFGPRELFEKEQFPYPISSV